MPVWLNLEPLEGVRAECDAVRAEIDGLSARRSASSYVERASRSGGKTGWLTWTWPRSVRVTRRGGGGINDVHAIRHACASWLIDAGANPLEVAEKLRHARVTTTFAVYGHLLDATGSRVDELLEAAHERARSAASCGADVVQLPVARSDDADTGR